MVTCWSKTNVYIYLHAPVPRVGFTQSGYTVVEDAGSAILEITSDGSNPDPVVVSYTVVEEDTQGRIKYTYV